MKVRPDSYRDTRYEVKKNASEKQKAEREKAEGKGRENTRYEVKKTRERKAKDRKRKAEGRSRNLEHHGTWNLKHFQPKHLQT